MSERSMPCSSTSSSRIVKPLRSNARSVVLKSSTHSKSPSGLPPPSARNSLIAMSPGPGIATQTPSRQVSAPHGSRPASSCSHSPSTQTPVAAYETTSSPSQVGAGGRSHTPPRTDRAHAGIEDKAARRVAAEVALLEGGEVCAGEPAERLAVAVLRAGDHAVTADGLALADERLAVLGALQAPAVAAGVAWRALERAAAAAEIDRLSVAGGVVVDAAKPYEK